MIRTDLETATNQATKLIKNNKRASEEAKAIYNSIIKQPKNIVGDVKVAHELSLENERLEGKLNEIIDELGDIITQNNNIMTYVVFYKIKIARHDNAAYFDVETAREMRSALSSGATVADIRRTLIRREMGGKAHDLEVAAKRLTSESERADAAAVERIKLMASLQASLEELTQEAHQTIELNRVDLVSPERRRSEKGTLSEQLQREAKTIIYRESPPASLPAGSDAGSDAGGGGKKSRRKRTKKSRTIGGKKSRKLRKRTTIKGGKRKRHRTRRRR